MNGTIAQILCLITYGNMILSNKIEQVNKNNETFKFCNKIIFVEFKDNKLFKNKKVIAKEPNEWFNYLKTGKCKKLKLYYITSDNKKIKDYQSSGFIGGGGRWLIEVIYDNYSDLWEPSWTVTKKDDPDNNIWTVIYYKIVSKIEKIKYKQNPDIKNEFIKSLNNIYDFSKKHREELWTKIFKKSLDILKKDKISQLTYYKDMLAPGSLSKENHILLLSAVNSWVFGAMGSWNDWWTENKEINDLYDKVTEDFYYKINELFVIIINTSASINN